MCVRTCVYVCLCTDIHICICMYKYAYVYRRTHICTRRYIKLLQCLVWLGPHLGEGDLSPDPLFHRSLQRVSRWLFFFFFPMKHITGEKKNLQTIQAFGDLGCLKDEQLKG